MAPAGENRENGDVERGLGGRRARVVVGEPGGNGSHSLLVVELQVHPVVDLIWRMELRRKHGGVKKKGGGE